MTKSTTALALVVCASLPCATPRAEDQGSYFDLGDYTREVTAATPAAASWFVRGLVQCYGFNHEEAVRCFERALGEDPEMAMAHWGIAYALGPNYNNVEMEAEAARRAFDAVAEARSRAGTVSDVERALIDAIETRYAWPAADDRTHLERAYAEAMTGVHARHEDDPDVAALHAEALMMLRPWALWSADGTAAPETPGIRRVLEKALARWPDHPHLCHLYIHVMEPSPDPGAALAAADRLRDRVPGSGHLVHMPSHIDVLLGNYGRVVETNRRAVEVDYAFVAREGRNNFYTLYRLHNLHFVVYGAMFDGQHRMAMEAAEELVREIPPELLRDLPDFLEAFVPTPLHVQVRFGRWQEILDVAAPPEIQPFTRAIWRYARTLAYASLGRVAEAGVEYDALLAVASKVPESRLLFNNACRDILKVAIAMAGGELEYRRGNHEVAFDRLRAAVVHDDDLNYDEPWGWMQPARHALGALLLEQGELEEAETVYRADLQRHPRNGWALHGLAEALRRRGRTDEAARTEELLAGSWVRSDTKLTASCFCRTGDLSGKPKH